MTTRFHSLQVVLDQDVREDDAEVLMNAIRMFRHVADVTGIPANCDTFMAETRARINLQNVLFEALKPPTTQDRR